MTLSEEIEVINEQLKECGNEEKCEECNNSSCPNRQN